MYLDFAATTPVNNGFINSVNNNIHIYANPQSNHFMGFNSRENIEQSTKNILNNIFIYSQGEVPTNIVDYDILYTSGSTESINTVFNAFKDPFTLFIYIDYDHKATLQCIKKYAHRSYVISARNICSDEEDFEVYEKEIKKLQTEFKLNKVVLSIITVNNETGDIIPNDWIDNMFESLKRVFSRDKIFIHLDHTQGMMKLQNYEIDTYKVDMISFSAHKFGGFKGFGGLIYNKRCAETLQKNPLIVGGGQQNGMRSGTENPLFVVSLDNLIQERIMYANNHQNECVNLKDTILNEIKNIADKCNIKLYINRNLRLRQSPHILNISLLGIEGESVLSALMYDCISTTSACNSDLLQSSHVLEALKIDKKIANCALRFSIDEMFISEEMVKDFFQNTFTLAIKHLARMRIRDLK